MRIQKVAFDNHSILGQVQITLLNNSDALPLENIPDTRVSISINCAPAPNQYTYIIGDNGVGKTIFFRTIIHAINLGSAVDGRLYGFKSFNEEDSKYGSKNLLDGSIFPLQKMGMHLNEDFIIRDPVNDNGNDFLNKYHGQLMYMTSTVENKIVHRNSRYRSFNHQSSVNVTSYLLLRAVFKNNQNGRIKRLNKLLDRTLDAGWKVSYRLPIDFKSTAPEGLFFIQLAATRNAFIVDFLKVLKSLGRDNKGNLTYVGEGNHVTSSVVDDLFKSGSFFKLYLDHRGNDTEFFKSLAESVIIKSLEEFINKIGEPSMQTTAGNFELTKEQIDNWNIHLDIENLSLFEINIMAVLTEHRAVELDITLNDVPVAEFSSGQQNLTRLFSYFADMPIPDNLENCIVFFDEPENSLHPKWQQQFPENFREIAEEVYQIKNSHFIFATHSPVLIMKAASSPDTDVIRFERNTSGDLTAEMIEHVNTFSIEEVLLDEFKISYRQQNTEYALKGFLDTQKAALPAHDPIHSVRNSFDLKRKIADLLIKTKTGK